MTDQELSQLSKSQINMMLGMIYTEDQLENMSTKDLVQEASDMFNIIKEKTVKVKKLDNKDIAIKFIIEKPDSLLNIVKRIAKEYPEIYAYTLKKHGVLNFGLIARQLRRAFGRRVRSFADYGGEEIKSNTQIVVWVSKSKNQEQEI